MLVSGTDDLAVGEYFGDSGVKSAPESLRPFQDDSDTVVKGIPRTKPSDVVLDDGGDCGVTLHLRFVVGF